MRLLAATPEEIQHILHEMTEESRAITKSITDIVTYSNGGVGWSEAWSMSPESRKTIAKSIGELLEFKKKTGLPF